ncbi:MAG: hypothetical protein DHS20C20_16050 [Ardenticatenaceae bacterium]|nr:MAG: hypothetical protein DHS20C20_16050 [Ardenticatenaceae bacterium]
MEESIWATVTEANGITVAELLAERLVAAEIPAQAVQKGAGNTFGHIGAAYVRVPEQFLDEARALLDVEEPADEDDIVNCPSCESEIELDEAEWVKGWFICPVCTAKVMLEQLF